MLIKADARQIPLRDGSVQCVVTSPPYWGLRDYGVAGQIGLERTPDEYVSHIVAAFREVRRVLRDDGTLWLNLGDSYAGSWGEQGRDGQMADRSIVSARQIEQHPRFGSRTGARGIGDGLKPKSLVGIPWRVAFALQADGWYLRSDIIWAKPNPMPESVTDRPTRAHEYIFLLTKRERYYYDAEAIREPYAESTLLEAERGYNGTAMKSYGQALAQDPSETKRRIIAGITKRRSIRPCDNRGGGQGTGAIAFSGPGRNKRSVWTIPTQPYHGAHFATFPEALVEPCILAGSREGDLVFDPFIGSGTVGVVAERLLRRWVGLDLNYHDLAKQRTAQRGLGLLTEV